MRELAGLFLLFIIAELVALIIVCVQAWRNPRGKEPASRWPDYPPDWLGGGSPHGIDLLDERTQPLDKWRPHIDGPSPGPYDRHDDYPGWGIPDGDTEPATDTPRGDRGMEGQSP